jgi:hypothetical protein
MKKPLSYEYASIIKHRFGVSISPDVRTSTSKRPKITLTLTEIARQFKAVINRCDICDDRLIECQDDIETKIHILQEIDDSYESEYDKCEPRLLLCNYCQKEYMIPGYKLN